MQFQLTAEQKDQMKKEVLNTYFDFEYEKKKLKSYLGDTLYEDLKQSNAIIGGGMIASIFTNKEINDVDVYFRTYEDLYLFAKERIGIGSGEIISHTKKATQFMDYSNDESVLVQLIHYTTYDKAESIFDHYDFTACMGAYDFATEEFILHPDFLKHNSQRILKFNSGTLYPLISAIRVDKYEKKGYTISKAEFFRIIMSCMTLEIKSYEELKEHLGGMYGEAYERLIEDIEEEEFDLHKVIEVIASITKQDSYFEEFISKNYDNNQVLSELIKFEKKVFETKSGHLYLMLNGTATEYSGGLFEDDELISPNEYYEGKKYYKFVKKKKDDYNRLFSFYDSKFEYVVGEEAVAEKELSTYGSSGRLFFNKPTHISNSTYYDRDEKVLIEVSILGDDVVEDRHGEITAVKCNVLRVVPEEEWKKWIKGGK